ncbi:hypothetical protein EMIT0P44_20278 [Pseudomonas sp. IT-P44]|jgi:hypothetical protein
MWLSSAAWLFQIHGYQVEAGSKKRGVRMELGHVSLIMVSLDFLMFIFSTVPNRALRQRSDCAQ